MSLGQLDGVRRPEGASSSSTSFPVASPPAWTIREREWAASLATSRTRRVSKWTPGRSAPDPPGPLLYQHLYRQRIAEAAAGGQGVSGVEPGGVVRINGGGDPAWA